MKYYHLAGLKTRLAMAVHFRPQKPIYAIDWHSFSYLGLETNTLFSVLLLSDTLCFSKGKKRLCKT